jgi:hypothetical protein
MERKNAFDYPRGLPNLLDRSMHGPMAGLLWVALVILLSCCILSALETLGAPTAPPK